MYTSNIYIVTISASDLKTTLYLFQILFNKTNKNKQFPASKITL